MGYIKQKILMPDKRSSYRAQNSFISTYFIFDVEATPMDLFYLFIYLKYCSVN